MNVIWKDGTSIAFDRSGSGPPLILVDGALCYRAFGPMGARVADALPNAQYRTLEGQTHMAKAKVQAPVLKEYFAGYR